MRDLLTATKQSRNNTVQGIKAFILKGKKRTIFAFFGLFFTTVQPKKQIIQALDCKYFFFNKIEIRGFHFIHFCHKK